MKRIKAVVQGSLNCDLIVNGMELPQLGQTVMGRTSCRSSGGKGANQAVQLAKLGAEVYMIGRVGRDSNGDFLLESLKKEGVHTDFVIRDQEPTGMGAVLCGEEGHYYAMVIPGANSRCEAGDILRAKEVIREADVLMSQLETTDTALYQMAALSKEYDIPWILNPAPAKPVKEELYALAYAMTPNETEAAFYAGISPSELESCEGWEKAAVWFRERGCARLVMTLGGNGCYLATEEKKLHQKGFVVQAIDTTAAGDAFNGAYAYGAACGMSAEEGLSFANAAGAVAASRRGAQDSMGSMEELRAFIRNQGVHSFAL